ncbi:hypothetical protein [Pseudomonas amygdali]|uniref:hypothetical protein n=1 Tax=Pseudomonas amygdali TaxID=47877 RepID=UPI0039F61ACD
MNNKSKILIEKLLFEVAKSPEGELILPLRKLLWNTITEDEVAAKEALIYSIFRPCNALEALIYQGATAGF